MLVVSCSKVSDDYCSQTYGNINGYSYVQAYVGLWRFVCVILVIISTIMPVLCKLNKVAKLNYSKVNLNKVRNYTAFMILLSLIIVPSIHIFVSTHVCFAINDCSCFLSHSQFLSIHVI